MIRDGDYWSDLERQRYEASIVDEAREMVAAWSGRPTVEHLRVLLEWLDGAGSSMSGDMQISHQRCTHDAAIQADGDRLRAALERLRDDRTPMVELPAIALEIRETVK